MEQITLPGVDSAPANDVEVEAGEVEADEDDAPATEREPMPWGETAE